MDIDKTNSGILKVFLMSYKSDPGRRNISKLYNKLNELSEEGMIYIKDKWEKEIKSLYTQKYGKK